VTSEERLAALEEKMDRLLSIVEDMMALFAPQLRKLKARSTGMIARMKERT
jgi:hypothetical protein